MKFICFLSSEFRMRVYEQIKISIEIPIIAPQNLIFYLFNSRLFGYIHFAYQTSESILLSYLYKETKKINFIETI